MLILEATCFWRYPVGLWTEKRSSKSSQESRQGRMRRNREKEDQTGEADYWKSMTCHREVTLIGPVLKVSLTSWPVGREFIFANEGMHHVGEVFEQAQHTNCTGLQLGHGDCQLSALSVWHDVQLSMPGGSRDEGMEDRTGAKK